MRKFFIAAMVAVASLVASGSTAQAAYTVRIYDDGVLQGGVTITNIGTTKVLYAADTTNFEISGNSLSNFPGTQGGSKLSISNDLQVTTKFGGDGGSHTLRIEISQTDWTAPVGDPLILSSSGGGSFDYLQGSNLSASQSVAVDYQGFLDNSNTLFGQPVAGSTPTISDSATRTTVGTTSLDLGNSVNPLVPGITAGSKFSMTDVLVFTFTVDAGSGQTAANISASSVASVPAPAGLVLALTGLPALGIGGWLRRRRQAV